jgi:hypothetical protein
MSSIHISSRNRQEISKIIESARERGSRILYYDALRILKLAGASVVNSFLALNTQEVMIFASQIEPPIVLKRVNGERLEENWIQTYKDIQTPISALNTALKDGEVLKNEYFVIQETAPKDLKLSIFTADNNIHLQDKRQRVEIILPLNLTVEELINQKDMLKTFLFNATKTEDYDIKALGMLLLIVSSIKAYFVEIDKVSIVSFYLYRDGLGYIITDAFIRMV